MIYIFPLLAALSFVTADVQEKSVSIVATALSPDKDQEIEFFLVGPGSENDYEAMFMTKASVNEIAEAFKKAGFDLGKFADSSKCIFYPSGSRVDIEPDLSAFVRDRTSKANLLPEVVFTGGERTEGGVPLASTNMPMAVFALYNLKQSLIQFNDSLPQSNAYGRFLPAQKTEKGKDFVFKFKLVENSKEIEYTADFDSLKSSKKIFDEIKRLSSGQKSINVTPSFSPELTVSEAFAIAQALQSIDSPKIKISGFKDGQFYYKSFFPRQSWRNRSSRLAQPVEIHFDDQSVPRLTIIQEDWSDEKSLTPKLNVQEHDIESTNRISKENTCFFFVNSTLKLKALYEIKSKLPSSIVNWYIFM